MNDTDFLKLEWTIAHRQKKSDYWYFFAPGHSLTREAHTSGMSRWVVPPGTWHPRKSAAGSPILRLGWKKDQIEALDKKLDGEP
jgi:hypothetical protein